MKPIATAYFFLGLIMLFCACSQQPTTLFIPVPQSQTHIDFINKIEEDVNFNILTYEYLYNGGGVAIADLNNDSLPDIVFSGNMVPSRIYLNNGNLSFEDVTAASGFKDKTRWKTGVVMADVNGDDLTDIYLCYSGPGNDENRTNQLFINTGVKNGIPAFTESAAQYGLDAPGTYSTTASFFDYDNDGDLDMFLVNHADMFFNPFYNTEKLRAKRHAKFGNRLYRNDNNIFKDVSDSAGIAGSGLNFGLSISTSDINKDGWTDIYVTNDYDERDFLYLNNKNGTFSEVLDKAAGHISEFAMGSDIADYNNDNNADVMVLDMLPEDNHRQKLLKGADTYDKYTTRVKHGFHHQQMRNTLQLNNGLDASGIPIFSEIGQLAGISKTDWSWAPLLADFDNDGWKDLFISNGIFKDITNLDFVKYTSGYSNSFTDKKGDKVEMWQLIKQMPSTKLDNYFYQNNGDLTFTDVSKSWGSGNKTISNGTAYSDLDNDGDLDLVINCLNDPPFILKNQSADEKKGNFLRIFLKGSGKNSKGIGAKVFIKSPSGNQYLEQFLTRGFQSSVDPIIHVGLGKDSIISEVKIQWPSGKISLEKNITANKLLTIKESEADTSTPANPKQNNNLFADVTLASGIAYTPKQTAFVDFKISPLLPYQPSKISPAIAAADVNGDGLKDFFISGSTTQDNSLFIQGTDGKFSKISNNIWNIKKDKTIADALFFDADNDGDMDLYLVAGGADYYLNAKNYQDELYTNDGKGNFSITTNSIPSETLSGSCVRSADVNKDGLQDLFIGNKYNYGQFPKAPSSKLLINKSVAGKILFVEDPSQTDPALLKPGMVSDAIFADLNNDGWQDLVVAGMFMPVTVFENEKGKLVNKTNEYGLKGTNGWWCRLLADDFDNDGFIDIVAGNLGNNTNFTATATEPLTVTYDDFNGDGVTDPVLTYYNQGKSYPYFSRDELFEQVPQLQKKFGRYADYADAQLGDLFSADQLEKAITANVNMLESVYLSNTGKGKMIIKKLPPYAQFSMAGGLISKDIDGDGNKDILVSGNCFPMRVQMGPSDASIGVVMKGDGKGNFQALPFEQTGFYVPGDVRTMITLKTKNKSLLVASRSDAAVQVISTN